MVIKSRFKDLLTHCCTQKKFNVFIQSIEVYLILLSILMAVNVSSAENFSELYASGITHLNAGQYNLAIEVFEKCFRYHLSSDDELKVRFYLGYAYYKEHRFDEAVRELKEALKLSPTENMKAYAEYLLGIIYSDSGDYKRAEKYFRQAAKNTSDMDYILSFAENCYRLGKFSKARKLFKKSISICKRSLCNVEESTDAYILHLNLGFAYTRIKEYKKAIDEYKKSIELNPDSVMAWNDLSWTYYIIGKYNKAIESAQKVILLNNDLSAVKFTYCNLGMIYFDKDMIEKSIESLKKARIIKTDDAYSKNCTDALFAVALYANGKIKQAKQIYTEIIKRNKNYKKPLWVKEIHGCSKKFIEELRKLLDEF